MMKQYHTKNLLCLIGCMVLIAAMALNLTGCGSSNAPETTDAGPSITFQVITVDLEGKETTFDVTTAEPILGDALVKEGLIAGNEDQYGLYVTTVNGITVTWEKDQMYWACYVNGEYAMTGVDSIEVEEGAVYTFKPEG